MILNLLVFLYSELYMKYCFAGLTWLLVYRTEKYQKLKVEIEKSSKKRMFSNLQKCFLNI